jgi:S1-C subfamily serine protease
MTSLLISTAAFLVATATPPARVPLEQKVVEIHMFFQDSPVSEQERRKNKKKVTLPLKAGTCSGSFVSGNGDVLTAKHCVSGFDSFEVQTSDRQVYRAVVVSSSPVQDLALLHIDKRDTPYLEMAKSARRGDRVFILGSPLGITDTLTMGIVAKLAGDQTLLDCGALPGNSGGPVLNENEEMVGVLVAGYIVMMGTTHLNIAQSLDTVFFFLKGAL